MFFLFVTLKDYFGVSVLVFAPLERMNCCFVTFPGISPICSLAFLCFCLCGVEEEKSMFFRVWHLENTLSTPTLGVIIK